MTESLRDRETCPECGEVWKQTINGVTGSRLIGVSDKDCIIAWQCPDCGLRWSRDTGERI